MSGKGQVVSDKRMQGAIKDYKDLLVWQKGMKLAKEIYLFTRGFPQEETFGLIAQMRRASVSVPSNVAEGQARHTTGEFVLFVSHAEGSLAELDTQTRLSKELGFSSATEADSILARILELQKMLKSLRAKLKA